MTSASALQNASQSAVSEPATPPDAIAVRCPLAQRKAIEVMVVDEEGQPLEDIAIEIAMSDRQVLLQRTAGNGVTRFERLVPGSYRLTLPLVDSDAWELIDSTPLAEPDSSGEAEWVEPPETPAPETYTVQLGDCLASIAYQLGFLPDTLWEYGANAALRDGVRRLHVVNPADIIHLPKLSRRDENASTGMRYKLRRKGVPERLRIRFVDYRLQPRAGTRFLLHVETASGNAVADRSGQLDGNGFLDVPIPPDALHGEVLLVDSAGEREEIEIDLGYVNPMNEVSGVQARLNNLHYDAGPETGEMNDATRNALKEFQLRHHLSVTGDIDRATKALLLKLHQS
jgi:hypothetical protein